MKFIVKPKRKYFASSCKGNCSGNCMLRCSDLGGCFGK